MAIKKNILFLILLFFVIYNISKNNIEKFATQKKVWSCYDGINGYCYNVDRANFNKSEWKAPEWNNTFNKKGKAITIYPNPAYKYSQCKDWLDDPLGTNISKECVDEISKDLRDPITNEEGISRSINVEENSDGFKYYCDSKESNDFDCDKFNFFKEGKNYVGFGNDDTKEEKERKNDFMNYCRRFGEIDTEFVDNWMKDPTFDYSSIDRRDINANARYVTKEITEEECRKKLCESNNKCKFVNNMCKRNYDNTNALRFRCFGRNNITPDFKDALVELNNKLQTKNIKSSDLNNEQAWNTKFYKEDYNKLTKFDNVIF